MICHLSNGRVVEIAGVYGAEDDIQISEASYVDSDEEVAEEDLAEIYESYGAELYEAWFDRQVSRADFLE